MWQLSCPYEALMKHLLNIGVVVHDMRALCFRRIWLDVLHPAQGRVQTN